MAEIVYLEEALPLSRYAELIGYAGPAFFGINAAGNAQFACRSIWQQQEREAIHRAIWEAQAMLERELGYPLATAAITDEAKPYRPIMLTEYGYVRETGQVNITSLGVFDVDWTADPPSLGPIPVTDTDHVFLAVPGQPDSHIIPGAIEALSSGGFVFYIPPERLVDPAHADNPVEGWFEGDYAVWGLSQVEVWQWSIDALAGATLRRFAPIGKTDSAEVEIQEADIGRVKVLAKDCCGKWDTAQLHYVAWYRPAGFESALMRLAHSLLPEEPCGCQTVKALWARDRNTSEVFTREKLNCPFGLSDGAWFAWRWAQTNALRRFSLL